MRYTIKKSDVSYIIISLPNQKNKINLKILKKLSSSALRNLEEFFLKSKIQYVKLEITDPNQLITILSIINSNKIIVKNNQNFCQQHYNELAQNFPDVLIEVLSGIYISPKKLQIKEEILNSIIFQTKNHNLSPLEQYMYLYNIVKKLKEYKRISQLEDDEEEKDTHYILFNDYISCAGFTNLLEELVERLNNPNLSLVSLNCQIEGDTQFGHSRCLVKINDEKYQIHNIFISDPTWDNSVDIFDSYTHFLMTMKEVADSKYEIVTSPVLDLIFNFSSLGKIIKHADLVEAFHKIRKLYKCPNLTNEEIVQIILNINQKEISKNVLFNAIRVIYSKMYASCPEKFEKILRKTFHDNQLNQHYNYKKYAKKLD